MESNKTKRGNLLKYFYIITHKNAYYYLLLIVILMFVYWITIEKLYFKLYSIFYDPLFSISILYITSSILFFLVTVTLSNNFFSSKEGIFIKNHFIKPKYNITYYFIKYDYIFLPFILMYIKLNQLNNTTIIKNILLSFILFMFIFSVSFILLYFFNLTKIYIFVVIGSLYFAWLLYVNEKLVISYINNLYIFFQNYFFVGLLLLTLIVIFNFIFLIRKFYQIETIKNPVLLNKNVKNLLNSLYAFFNFDKAFITKDLILITRMPKYIFLFSLSIIFSLFFIKDIEIYFGLILFLNYLLASYTIELFQQEVAKRNILKLIPINIELIWFNKFVSAFIINIFINLISVAIITLKVNINLQYLAFLIIIPLILQLFSSIISMFFINYSYIAFAVFTFLITLILLNPVFIILEFIFITYLYIEGIKKIKRWYKVD